MSSYILQVNISLSQENLFRKVNDLDQFFEIEQNYIFGKMYSCQNFVGFTSLYRGAGSLEGGGRKYADFCPFSLLVFFSSVDDVQNAIDEYYVNDIKIEIIEANFYIASLYGRAHAWFDLPKAEDVILSLSVFGDVTHIKSKIDREHPLFEMYPSQATAPAVYVYGVDETIYLPLFFPREKNVNYGVWIEDVNGLWGVGFQIIFEYNIIILDLSSCLIGPMELDCVIVEEAVQPMYIWFVDFYVGINDTNTSGMFLPIDIEYILI